jgi:hypothetical protein
VTDPQFPASRGHARRAVLGSIALAAVGTPIVLSRVVADAATKPAAGPFAPLPAVPLWNPDPASVGLAAFEGVEDDRAHSHPGVKHIYVQGNAFRVDMHRRDRDTSKDRQRNEVKGMHVVDRRTGKGSNLELDNGQTWRIVYDLFMPETLKGCDHFCHIFQLKRPGPGSAPLVTMSLRRKSGQEQIALRSFASGGDIGAIALAPLRNKWITVDMTFKIGDKGAGRLLIHDGGRTVVDSTRTGIDIWLGDRIRPKWGIYRSIQSPASQIIDTYLLIRNMRAYRA